MLYSHKSMLPAFHLNMTFLLEFFTVKLNLQCCECCEIATHHEIYEIVLPFNVDSLYNKNEFPSSQVVRFFMFVFI